jgi:hypothetical protein
MSNELKDLFLVHCKKCGSDDVDIFNSSYGGEITVACDKCDNEKEI